MTPPHADPTEKNVGENETSSYDITMNGDPLMDCENYDIGDLSSEDSTDDEDCPKKVEGIAFSVEAFHMF